MVVRSARLAGPVSVPAGTVVTLFTVEAGETWLVKRVTVFNPGVVQQIGSFYINGTGAVNVVRTLTTAATSSTDDETWWVLVGGDTLRFRADAANAQTVSVHGAELEGIAD